VSVGDGTSRDREYCPRVQNRNISPTAIQKGENKTEGSTIHDGAKDLTVSWSAYVYRDTTHSCLSIHTGD